MLASDFSGLVWVALAIIASVVFGCLLAGAVTAGVVVVISGQKKYWWLTIPFSGLWFAVGWFVMEVLEL